MAIVQQEDVACAESASEAGEHGVGIAATCIVAASRPAREPNAELRQHGIEKRITQARKRTEELRASTGDLFQRFLCDADLTLPAADAVKRSMVSVALTVVFNGVSTRDDVATDFRMGGGPFSDTEKGRVDLVSVQEVEHLRRDFRIRSVIKGKRHFPALRRRCGQTHEIRAQQSAAGRQADRTDYGMVEQHNGKRPFPARWCKQRE